MRLLSSSILRRAAAMSASSSSGVRPHLSPLCSNLSLLNPPLPAPGLLSFAAGRLPAPRPRPRILRRFHSAAVPQRGRRVRQRGLPLQRRARRQRLTPPRRRRPWPSASVQAGPSTTAAVQAGTIPTASIWVRLWLRLRPPAAGGPHLRGCAVQLRPPAAAATAGASAVRLRGSESILSQASAAPLARARECWVPSCGATAGSQAGGLPPTVAVCKTAAASPSG
jgi:hypothetical protein